MSNKWILLAYAALFFGIVSTYDSYADNTYLVALAGVTLTVLGVGAWLWSVQPKKTRASLRRQKMLVKHFSQGSLPG